MIRDVALSLATRAVTISAGVITSILTARVLGVAGRGEYFYIITLASLVVQFGHLGLASSNTYALAKDHTLLARLAANSIWVSFIAGTCAALVVLLLVAGWNVTKWEETHAWLLLVMGPAMLYSLLAANLLIGLTRIRQYNLFQIVSAFFQLTAISMACWMSWGVAGFLTTVALASAAAALVLMWFLARLHSLRWRFDRELFGSQLGYAGRAYIITLFGYGVSRMGVLFLNHYAGKSEIGIYSVAVQLADVLVIIPSTTAMVLFPNLMKSDIQGQYARALAVTWRTGLIMLGLCFSLGVAAYWLIPMVFGDAFAPAVYVLWWMLPGVLVLSMTTIISQYLGAQGMPRGNVLAWIAGLLFLVVSCQQLVPQWGARGAAMGLSLTYVLLGCSLFAFAYRHHRKAVNASAFGIGTTSMDAILTNYPISRNFQQRLATLITGDVINISLTELKQRPTFKLLTDLRSLRVENLFLPIEDENGSALLPVLKLVASIVPARHIYLVEPDLHTQRISRLDAIGSVVRLAYASVVVRTAVARARHEIGSLLATERIAVDKVIGFEVLYLNANLWFGVKAGGSVGHISGVVNALLQTGYAVHFASAGGRLMVKDAATYMRLVPPAYFGLPPEFNHYRFHFNVVQQLKQLAVHRRFDFIYQRLSIANYSGVVLSRSAGIPLVLEYNGSEAWIARNWGRHLHGQALAEQVEEANLRHAHLVVTISDVLRDELLDRGVAPERIVSYPNCIDPEMFDPARFTAQEVTELRRRHGIPADAVVVTFIGTFGQWHGAEVLAQAIQQLIDDHQGWVEAKKVHFLLVGDGLKMPDVRKILGNHANGPYVTLAGLVPQHEAPLYLASSDILCSPHVPNADGTKFFGSPTKLFEYMAMGKAIVASDLDQIGEVLANSLKAANLPLGDGFEADKEPLALLCQPGSASQHADGIRFLVNHQHWRERLGRNARREALARYTWRHHVQTILAGLASCG